MAVMGNHNDRSEIFRKEVFQPRNGINIQMVGRFVHENDVRIAEQCLCEQDFHLFVTGEVAHGLVQQIFGKSQSLQELGNIRFRFPAVQFCKFGFEFRSMVAVLFGEVRLCIQGIFFLHDGIEPFIAHNHRVENGVGIIGEVVLLQNAHPEFFRDGNFSGCGWQNTAQNFQERGFSSTVCTDDPIAVSGVELQIDVLKEGVAAELEADVGYSNHEYSFQNTKSI